MITDVRSCARCGGDHDAVEFQELVAAIESGNVMLTHWAPCPSTREPILLRVILEEVTDAP